VKSVKRTAEIVNPGVFSRPLHGLRSDSLLAPSSELLGYYQSSATADSSLITHYSSLITRFYQRKGLLRMLPVFLKNATTLLPLPLGER